MVLSIDGKLSASISMDTGTAQGSTLSPLLFKLFINVLFRCLDSTGVTHNVQGALVVNSLGFTDDLSLCVGNERDGNTLLEIVKKFEDWSGLKISIAKSFVTGALLQKEAERRLTGSKRQEKKNEMTMRAFLDGSTPVGLARHLRGSYARSCYRHRALRKTQNRRSPLAPPTTSGGTPTSGKVCSFSALRN